jgi:predicted nucleotidyltransferase
MQFETVLTTFDAFFEREKIRYVLIGGMAMQAWGRSRLTKDVDFAVDIEAQDKVVAFAESLGYETLHVSTAYSNHASTSPTLGRVDFMYVSGRTAERIFDARVLKPIVGNASAPVASPEHLAMMKAVAMKNFPHRALFEGEDVRLLLNVPGVDRTAIRDYYRQQGLLELYDAIEKAR